MTRQLLMATKSEGPLAPGSVEAEPIVVERIGPLVDLTLEDGSVYTLYADELRAALDEPAVRVEAA